MRGAEEDGEVAMAVAGLTLLAAEYSLLLVTKDGHIHIRCGDLRKQQRKRKEERERDY